MARKMLGQAAIESAKKMPTAGCLKGQAAIESAKKMPTAGCLKGQAAMEYLVTYGWALLALFLVIALLIASGAFSTGGFTPQECVFQPDMPCSSYILYRSPSESATILRFSLTNGLGFPINITNITYTATSLGQQDRRTYESGVSSLSPVGLASGATREFAYKFTGSAQPQLREMKTVIVALTYYNCKGGDCTGPYQTTGRISAFVEQGTAGLPDS